MSNDKEIADYIRSLHCIRWKDGDKCFKTNCQTFHYVADLIAAGEYKG